MPIGLVLNGRVLSRNKGNSWKQRLNITAMLFAAVGKRDWNLSLLFIIFQSRLGDPKGGWESEDVIQYFAEYVEYVMKKLGNEIKYVCTINEANMGLQISSIMERQKRQEKANASRRKEEGQQVQLGMDSEKMEENERLGAEENERVFYTATPQIILQQPYRTREYFIVMKAHQKRYISLKNFIRRRRQG